MVKPSSGSNLSRSGSNAGQDGSVRGRPPAVPPPSGNSMGSEDLSLVVVTNGSCPPSMNGNRSMTSMASQNSLALSLDVNPDEMQRKLQDVLKENVVLKEALQQNNLAMKQQFSTLSTWHEEVRNVHQSHKAKFDEMKALILKLKNENEALSKRSENLPKIDQIATENTNLKLQIQDFEKKLQSYQAVVKENTTLKDQVSNLEKKIATGMISTDAQEKAERRVRELAEERVELLRDKQELQQRAVLLQEELASVEADGFVLLNSEALKKKPEESKKLSTPQDKLNNFYAILDKYEERLMESYKSLDNQVDSFSAVYKWLDEARAKMPCSSSSLTEMGTLLEMVSLSLREAQQSSTSHRLRLEESSQQLGRLSSDFQGMLQDYLSLSNELKNTKADVQEAVSSTELKEKVDYLTGQLLEAKEKLTMKDKYLTQLNVSLDKKEAEITKMTLELQQRSSDPSMELKEQLDHMTAQLLEMKDVLEQKDKNIEKHSLSIAQRDGKLAQMELKVSQAETKATQKESELVANNKKLKNVEQSVDALQAQCEVYKMDFNEERESREKLATDKEKVADELRASQQEIQQLNAELEALKKRIVLPPPGASANAVSTSASRPQPHNYNTIATPGRNRGKWPSGGLDGSDQPEEPKYECPKCMLVFKSLHPLENHVDFCLDQDMFP